MAVDCKDDVSSLDFRVGQVYDPVKKHFGYLQPVTIVIVVVDDAQPADVEP